MTLGISTALWNPSKGCTPSKLNCGSHGRLTVAEIARRTGLSKAGVFSRIVKMRKHGGLDVEQLLRPARGRHQPLPKFDKVDAQPVTPKEDPYYEGVAAYPSTDCPYHPISLPESYQNRQHSPMTHYAKWWAGWHDTDRGLT